MTTHCFAARRTLTFAVVAAATLLAACVYVPRTTEVYDENCHIVTRQMVLEEHQIGAIAGCRNDGCLVMVATAGVVAAATAIVSGSIVVAGNVLFWLEKQGQCRPRNP